MAQDLVRHRLEVAESIARREQLADAVSRLPGTPVAELVQSAGSHWLAGEGHTVALATDRGGAPLDRAAVTRLASLAMPGSPILDVAWLDSYDAYYYDRSGDLPLPVVRVGLYVPAGSAPLPSTALMLCVPAKLAGCRQIVLCTPPRADGTADPAVLYAARACGVDTVFKLGGVQAVAAMAFGTASVPRCDKLYGPGNAYVTAAKQRVSQLPGGPAIDMPAGPSEVLVVADAIADAEFVAADLLSQAEHGHDSQALLVTPSVELVETVDEALRELLQTLSRAGHADLALANSRAILVEDLVQAVEVSNAYAPEHLILNVADPRRLMLSVENAGSIFLGRYTPESLGDYTSGTNHVLPTYGHARTWSGLSVQSFQKLVTVQEASADGLKGIGPAAITLANAEGLSAHALAVQLRLRAIASEGRP